MKILLFLGGLLAGTSVSAAWLLSDPEVVSSGSGNRLDALKARLDRAVADGRRAGEETANRVRHELDANRLHPDRPGTSSSGNR